MRETTDTVPENVKAAWDRFAWNPKPSSLNEKDMERLYAVHREAEKADYVFSRLVLDILSTSAGFRSAIHEKIERVLLN